MYVYDREIRAVLKAVEQQCRSLCYTKTIAVIRMYLRDVLPCLGGCDTYGVWSFLRGALRIPHNADRIFFSEDNEEAMKQYRIYVEVNCFPNQLDDIRKEMIGLLRDAVGGVPGLTHELLDRYV